MTINDKKEILIQLEIGLSEKITALKQQITDLTTDAQNDAKGSAGDKHETGLAMMHLEQEKLSTKLKEVITQLQNIRSISIDKAHRVISMGSLIDVETAIFFVSEALPHFIYHKKMIFPLSTQAPIYIELKGKKAGDSFQFNNKLIHIKTIV